MAIYRDGDRLFIFAAAPTEAHWTRSRQDRRVVEVGITEKGTMLLRGLDAHVQRLPKALLGHLGAERLRQLSALLDSLLSDLGTFP